MTKKRVGGVYFVERRDESVNAYGPFKSERAALEWQAKRLHPEAWQVAHLVPADPLKERVYKAALKAGGRWTPSLKRAIEAALKKKG